MSELLAPTTMNNYWRNRARESLYSGQFILMSGGMHLSLSLGWSSYTYTNLTTPFVLLWFIGVIVGCLTSLELQKTMPKRYIMVTGALLVLASGVIFISIPANYDALVAGRYFSGLGVGFVMVPCLIHAAEIADNTNRGYCLSLEQFSFAAGISFQVMFGSQQQSDWFAMRVYGCMDILYAVLSIAASWAIVESPVFHLRQNNELGALESLQRLQRPDLPLDDKFLTDLKADVAEKSVADPVVALKRMLLYRSMVAITFSVPLLEALKVSADESIFGAYGVILFGLLRWLGTIAGITIPDAMGRKLVSNLCLLLMGGLSTAVAIILGIRANWSDPYAMGLCTILLLVLQFVAGVFIPNASVYLGEAFPLKLKAYCIGACVIFEMIIYMLQLWYFPSVFDIYPLCWHVFGVSLILYAAFVLFSLTLPETKNLSLSEASRRFKHWNQLHKHV